MTLADRIAGAATAFLHQLDGARAAAARLPFEAEDRRAWDYRPGRRRGVALGELAPAQVKAATRLLAELLPVPALARALTIVGLEEVLDRLEGRRRGRSAGDYWTALFGEPGAERWGLRFEGHHVSVNVTVCGGEAQLTPLFLGANPAIVHDGGRPAVAPLGPEEQLGFELLHALSTEQRVGGGPGRPPARRHRHGQPAAARRAIPPGGSAAGRALRIGGCRGPGAARRLPRPVPGGRAAAAPRRRPLRAGGRRAARLRALLPHRRPGTARRARQHPERGQPRPLRRARPPGRLRRGPPRCPPRASPPPRAPVQMTVARA